MWYSKKKLIMMLSPLLQPFKWVFTIQPDNGERENLVEKNFLADDPAAGG